MALTKPFKNIPKDVRWVFKEFASEFFKMEFFFFFLAKYEIKLLKRLGGTCF